MCLTCRNARARMQKVSLLCAEWGRVPEVLFLYCGEYFEFFCPFLRPCA